MSRLRELAYISGLRGSHGTGVCQGLATKKILRITLEKSHQDVTYFMWYNDNHAEGNDKILNDYSCNFIMGHVRAATRGNITDENAHPFDTGRYISAHNGTLYDKKYQHETKTDSQMMFEDVENRGLYNVLRDVEKDSAYAVVSFDRTNKELSFATNGKRPLVYAYLNHRRVFFWASEKRQLDFILAGVAEKSDIYKFSEDFLYTFRPEDVRAGRSPDWSTRKIKKEFEPPVVGTQFRFQHQPGPSSVVRPPVTETRQSNIIRISDKGKHPIAELISSKREEHERVHKANALLVKCIYCTKEMDLLEQYLGTQIDVSMYSCQTCNDLQAEMLKQKHHLN